MQPIDIAGEDPVLPTAFPVGEAAATALALCGGAAAELVAHQDGSSAVGERRRTRRRPRRSMGFLMQRLDGNVTPRTAAGNPFVALYECADGRWIHLHGAMPKLHAGTIAVLGCAKDADAAAVAAAVKTWDSQKLEDALAEAGTCGAIVRTAAEWAAHPQGIALADLAAVEIEKVGEAPPQPLPDGDQPLSGIRALDLTRILAGPTCGRTLAQHGADVMLVNAPASRTSRRSSSTRATASCRRTSTSSSPTAPRRCAASSSRRTCSRRDTAAARSRSAASGSTTS